MRHYLGVDPGKEGGVALLDAEGRLVKTEPTPLVDGKGAGDYNLVRIVLILEGAIDLAGGPQWLTACVELLHALPPIPRVGMRGGSAANFARGLSHGWLWMLAALRVKVSHHPRPQTWQPRMLAAGPADTSKERSKASALARWPSHDFRRTPRSHGPHDGLTDAALLAEYGRLMSAAEGLSEHETSRLFRQKGNA
jgi:hypothetical protein